MFSKKQNPDPNQFWEKRESELGTPILGKTLGRVVLEDETKPSFPLWGLLYTSADSVFFQTFKSESWTLLLLGGKGATRGEDEIREISFTDLTRVQLTTSAGIIKLFRKPPVITIQWKEAAGETPHSLSLEVIETPKTFLETFPSSLLS